MERKIYWTETKWFAFDFLGNEEEIKIKQENIKQEFCSWKWVSPMKYVISLLILREIYIKVLWNSDTFMLNLNLIFVF